MKIIRITLILLIVSTLKVNAGDIDYIKTANSITAIGSKSNLGSIGNAFSLGYMVGYTSTKKALPVYSLELYTDGVTIQYAIKIYLGSTAKNPQLFPTHSKILLKLSDDSILELASIFSNLYIEKSYSSAYFPVTESQLQRIFVGVKKMRMEILALNKENSSVFIKYQDSEYKKDKMGKQIERWYNTINKEYEKIKKELLEQKGKIGSSVKDIKENF